MDSHSPLLSPIDAPMLASLVPFNDNELLEFSQPVHDPDTELCPFCDNPLPELSVNLCNSLNKLISHLTSAPNPENPQHHLAKLMQFAFFCESHHFPSLLAEAQCVGWPLTFDFFTLVRCVISLKVAIWAFTLYPANTSLIGDAIVDSQVSHLNQMLNIIGAG